MSAGTGGIYKGPGGQDLYGDGREVNSSRTLPSLVDNTRLPISRQQAFTVSVTYRKPRRFWGWKIQIKRWLVLESTEQRALLALDLDRSILPSLRAAGCEIINWIVEPVVVNHNQRVIIEL
jgi:hypothetical protein